MIGNISKSCSFKKKIKYEMNPKKNQPAVFKDETIVKEIQTDKNTAVKETQIDEDSPAELKKTNEDDSGGTTGTIGGDANFSRHSPERAAPVPPYADGARHRIIASNIAGETMEELLAAFELIAEQNPKISKPVVEISISADKKDRVALGDWRWIGKGVLKTLGYENSLFIIVQHRDRAHDHIHILTSQIDILGTTIDESQSKRRLEEYLKTAEIAGGFVQTVPSRDSRRAALKRGELENFTEKGELSVKLKLQMKVDDALEMRHSGAKFQPAAAQASVDSIEKNTVITQSEDGSPAKVSTAEFLSNLEAAGALALPRFDEKGMATGISFFLDGKIMKGSSLGRGFSWNGLQQRGLDYQPKRDHQMLSATKEKTEAVLREWKEKQRESAPELIKAESEPENIDINTEKADRVLQPNRMLSEKMGNEMIALMDLRQTQYELKQLAENRATGRYKVTLDNGAEEWLSLDYLDKRARFRANEKVKAEVRTGAVATCAFQRRISEWEIKREINNSARAEEIVAQSNVRAQIENAHERAMNILGEKLSEQRAEAEKLRRQTDEQFNISGAEERGSATPKMDGATVWQLQEKALKRGDGEGFALLEEIHRESGELRSNYAVSRLSALARHADLNGKLAAHRQNELDEKGGSRFYKLTMANVEGQFEVKKWSLDTSRENEDELDERTNGAKKLAHRGFLKPFENQINVFSKAQKKFSWFTDPKGTLNAHFNPIEIIKNEPAVQTVRSIYNFIKARREAQAAQAEAEKLTNAKGEIAGKIEAGKVELARRSNNFKESSDLAENALSRERELRAETASKLEGSEPVNTDNLKMPMARFQTSEVREMQQAAFETNDAEMMQKIVNVIEKNPLLATALGHTPERALGQALMTKAESSAQMNGLVKTATAATGEVELSISEAAIDEVGKNLSANDYAQKWIDDLLAENPELKAEFTETEIMRLQEIGGSLTDESGKALSEIINRSTEKSMQREIVLDETEAAPTVSQTAAVTKAIVEAETVAETVAAKVQRSKADLSQQTFEEAANDPTKLAREIEQLKVRALAEYQEMWKKFARNPEELTAMRAAEGAQTAVSSPETEQSQNAFDQLERFQSAAKPMSLEDKSLTNSGLSRDGAKTRDGRTKAEIEAAEVKAAERDEEMELLEW